MVYRWQASQLPQASQIPSTSGGGDAAAVAWTTQVPGISSDVNVDVFKSIVVPTVDSCCTAFLLDVLVQRNKPVLLVGVAGTAKTTMVKQYMNQLDSDHMHSTVVNCNYYTDSLALQQQLESGIDKRSGRTYGPPPPKNMLYFIDDLNMACAIKRRNTCVNNVAVMSK